MACLSDKLEMDMRGFLCGVVVALSLTASVAAADCSGQGSPNLLTFDSWSLVAGDTFTGPSVLLESVCTVSEDDPGTAGLPDASFVWLEPTVGDPVTVVDGGTATVDDIKTPFLFTPNYPAYADVKPNLFPAVFPNLLNRVVNFRRKKIAKKSENNGSFGRKISPRSRRRACRNGRNMLK
jgi:hypothetical protein